MDQATADDENTPLMYEAQKPRKKTFLEILRDEFRWKSFGFDYHDATAFYRSQWRFPRLIFVLFRLSLALYTGIICIMTIVYFPHRNPHRPWIVWLTNWSYLMLTCHEILSAVIVLVHSKDRTSGYCCMELGDGEDDNDAENDRGTKRRTSEGRRRDSLPFYMKLSWLIYCIASPVAIIILLTFLVSIDLKYLPVKDLNNHVMNGIVILLEVCVAALPVRLFHLVYVAIYHFIYYLFAYVFWTGDHTLNVLYPGTVDWNEPGDTVINWVFAAILRPLGIQIFLFIVYRLKVFITEKIYVDEERSC